MTSFDERLKMFALDLFKINAIKFGEYKTKIGLMTPVYCDLRLIVSHPKLLNTLADLIVEYLTECKQYDILCGVPYTALPIATVISIKANVPMVMRRKESKNYGTKKMIEGQFSEGDRCLIIEDVITSGSSILETVKDLKASGIKCENAVVLLDREQGGRKLLEDGGIKVHSLLRLTEVMEYLNQANYIDKDTVHKVGDYINNTQVDPNVCSNIQDCRPDRLTLAFLARIQHSKNAIGRKLFHVMSTKKTTLCVAADLTNTAAICNLAEQVGPHICMLKTHIDIVDDFQPSFLKQLRELADRHNFILFEDRKFADIGKTVQSQYRGGIYKISSWASVVTSLALTGKGVLDAINASEGLEDQGVFLLAETSARGNLIDDNYVTGALKLASEYSDLIIGVVCQNPLFIDKPGLIQLTPGVSIGSKQDGLSQTYNTPEQVVIEQGADVAVVGRGITEADDPASEAQKYKELLWEAYEKRMKCKFYS